MGFLSFRYSLVRLRGLPYASSEQASYSKKWLEHQQNNNTKHNDLIFSGLMMSS